VAVVLVAVAIVLVAKNVASGTMEQVAELRQRIVD